jgi:hypothetical protein
VLYVRGLKKILSKVNVFGEASGNVDNIQSPVEKEYLFLILPFQDTASNGIFAALQKIFLFHNSGKAFSMQARFLKL